jgi:hypothetical protein
MAIEDVLHLIDIRIKELQQARSILAACIPSTPKKQSGKVKPIERPAPAPVAVVPVTVIPTREPRERRARIVQPIVQTPSALTKSIPSAPVIISAAEARGASRMPQVQQPLARPGAWLLQS